MQTSREEMNSGQLTSYCAQTGHAKQVVAVKYYSKTLKQLFGRCYANSPHMCVRCGRSTLTSLYDSDASNPIKGASYGSAV